MKSEDLETKVKTLTETVKKLQARYRRKKTSKQSRKITEVVRFLPRTLAGR